MILNEESLGFGMMAEQNKQFEDATVALLKKNIRTKRLAKRIMSRLTNDDDNVKFQPWFFP